MFVNVILLHMDIVQFYIDLHYI